MAIIREDIYHCSLVTLSGRNHRITLCGKCIGRHVESFTHQTFKMKLLITKSGKCERCGAINSAYEVKHKAKEKDN